MTGPVFSSGQKLGRSFYTREDVVLIARELLGKVLCTQSGDGSSCAIITETEAYAGVSDRASHAYGHRRTKRTGIMYREGGVAYVYLCYGIHHLFNVVTHSEDVPHAILVRGVYPLEGKELMASRMGRSDIRSLNTTGPGRVSKALGITIEMTGEDLLGDRVWIEERGLIVPSDDVTAGPRVGVDYAGEDARLPYRFLIGEDVIKR